MMSGENIYLILENCSHFINVPMQQSVYHFYIEIPFHTSISVFVFVCVCVCVCVCVY